MLPWVYNDGQFSGLARIKPQNSGMPELAASGNVLLSLTGPHLAHVSGAAGDLARSGNGQAGRQFAVFPIIRGLARRAVDWRWRIAATSEANLIAVESLIGKYLIDGGEFTLSDGVRSSTNAVLSGDGTQRLRLIGPAGGGRWICDWRLRFLICVPVVDATKF